MKTICEEEFPISMWNVDLYFLDVMFYVLLLCNFAPACCLDHVVLDLHDLVNICESRPIVANPSIRSQLSGSCD